MDSEDEGKVTPKKVIKAICIIGLIIGIMLWLSAYTTETYDLSDFRSQRGARYVDKTEDLLAKNETCKIEGNTIKVTERNEGVFIAGMVMTIVFGLIDGIWLFLYLDEKGLI